MQLTQSNRKKTDWLFEKKSKLLNFRKNNDTIKNIVNIQLTQLSQ